MMNEHSKRREGRLWIIRLIIEGGNSYGTLCGTRLLVLANQKLFDLCLP